MMVGGKIADLTAHEDIALLSYNSCLAQIVCNPSQPACYLRTCPGVLMLKDRLKILIDENLIDTVVHKKWVSVDRSTLETFTKSADYFVDSFCDK